MQARSAADLEDLFEDAYAARDAAALVGLFQDNAVVVAPGGDQRRGSPAIAGLAEEFWRNDVAYISEITHVVEADGVALVVVRWQMSGRDGNVVDQGTGVDVVRRQPDGTWKYVITMPGGPE